MSINMPPRDVVGEEDRNLQKLRTLGFPNDSLPDTLASIGLHMLSQGAL